MKDVEVLVVDDDEIVCEQTSVILEEIGAHSIWVSSGREALEQVSIAVSQGRTIDVAMIDWKMPDMDGIETTRRIREITGTETMIIIISAYDWSSIEEEARKAGANFFIPKPLFRSTIYNTFSRLEMCIRDRGFTMWRWKPPQRLQSGELTPKWQDRLMYWEMWEHIRFICQK